MADEGWLLRFPQVFVFPVVLDQTGAIQLLRPFIKHLLDNPYQLLVFDGFQEVLRTPVLQGFVRILEVGVTGQEDGLRARNMHLHPHQQIDAALSGHFNVADDDIDRLAGQDFLGFHRTAGGQDACDVQGLPVNSLRDAHHRIFFVIHNQQSEHGNLLSGLRTVVIRRRHRECVNRLSGLFMSPPCCRAHLREGNDMWKAESGCRRPPRGDLSGAGRRLFRTSCSSGFAHSRCRYGLRSPYG